MSKFSVIVVAAGKGERFSDKENKIFTKIGEQPVFLMALQRFCNREDVCQTILVVSKDDTDKMKSQYGPNLGFMGITLVEGGAHRHESVANGLARVSDEAEFVAVHDAARVCIADQWIDEYFTAAARFGSAVPVSPVTSTIKRVSEDKTIGETVSREGLFLAMTPQIFRKKMIVEAYAKLKAGQILAGAAPTDDAQIVTAAGMDVTAIDADPRNIKITTQSDVTMASAILKTLPARPVNRTEAFEEAQW